MPSEPHFTLIIFNTDIGTYCIIYIGPSPYNLLIRKNHGSFSMSPHRYKNRIEILTKNGIYCLL